MMPVIDESVLRGIVARLRAACTDSGRCEVKACVQGLTKDIARTLSGFANGAGGILICGLDERQGFAPAAGFDAGRVQDALARVCDEELTPRLRPAMDVLLFEGAPVLVASIEELRPIDKPCFVSRQGRYSGSYIRTGDGDRRLSMYEIDRLLEERVQPRHDEAVMTRASMDDLDPRLVERLLARERSVHARTFAALDDQTALVKLGVLGKGEDGAFHPTLAGLVALGSYPQEFFPRLVIAFTCYPTSEKGQTSADGRRFADAYTCVGSASAMVEDALAAVERNTRTGARIEGAFRYDVADYPRDALREALVNAVMHRDYSPESLGSAIALDLYPDRLEISNPGGLYGVATIDRLGLDGMASSRNMRLASILESTPCQGEGYLAENRGTGYRVMRRACAEMGLPEPLPRDDISQFSLTLYGPLGIRPADGALRLSERSMAAPDARAGRCVVRTTGALHVPTLLGKTAAEVLETVRAEGEASCSELVGKTGRSRPTVLKALRELVGRGLLEPSSPVKNDPHLRYRAI